jgi:exopolysaccharide biosynthesis polyprenyl glycosylphosphotransferase
MRKPDLLQNLAALPVDIIAWFSACALAFTARQYTTEVVGPIIYSLTLQDFLITALKILPLQLLIMASFGLYNIRGSRSLLKKTGKIIASVSLGLLLVITVFFFNPQLFPSRFIILAVWVLVICFLSIGRMMIGVVQHLLFKRGLALHRVLLLGSGSSESGTLQGYYTQKRGYKTFTLSNSDKSLLVKISELIGTERLDEVIQTESTTPDSSNAQILAIAKNHGIIFSYSPNLFEIQLTKSLEITKVKGLPILTLKSTPLDGWGKVAKRSVDIAASIICVLITLPAFVIMAFAIKLNSKGPVIFAAPRGGKGKDFMFYKFRSMFTHLSTGSKYGGEEAEKLRKELWQKNDRGGAAGPFLKIKDDPRVTKVGRFLRKTKLDEIPQFYNVLKGDMSMVGPRAHVLDEVSRYKSSYPRMFSIKPGIFGVSQIAQSSWPDLPFEEEIRLNLYYIENWSLWMDIKILVQSVYLILFGNKSKDDY